MHCAFLRGVSSTFPHESGPDNTHDGNRSLVMLEVFFSALVTMKIALLVYTYILIALNEHSSEVFVDCRALLTFGDTAPPS